VEGFFLVVGDVDGGEAELIADAADFAAHVEAEFGVEVGERFVEEETVWSDGEGSGEGDALLLTAGELVDAAFAEMAHLDHVEGFADAGDDVWFGEFAFLEAEGDVFSDAEVRPEGVALEHHGGVAAVGGDA
jgi:hypothetical protein